MDWKAADKLAVLAGDERALVRKEREKYVRQAKSLRVKDEVTVQEMITLQHLHHNKKYEALSALSPAHNLSEYLQEFNRIVSLLTEGVLETPTYDTDTHIHSQVRPQHRNCNRSYPTSTLHWTDVCAVDQRRYVKHY